MANDAISALTSSTSTAGTSGSSSGGLSNISGESFMNILVKQLQMQDPFEPMGNEEMVAQISTIRELEMNTRLSESLAQLSSQQRFGSAGALIGRQVSGTVSDENGNDYALGGVVTGVRFTSDGEILLELDSGQVMPLTVLEQVTEANAAETDTSGKNSGESNASGTDDASAAA